MRGDTPQSDTSLVPWDHLLERLQEANRRQADDIGVKLATLDCALAPLTDWDADRFTFTPDEVELLAAKEHGRWMDDYLSADWVRALVAKQDHRGRTRRSSLGASSPRTRRRRTAMRSGRSRSSSRGRAFRSNGAC